MPATTAQRVPFGRVAPPKAKSASPRLGLVYGLFAVLALSNVATGVGFLMSPDIARLVSGQNEVVLSAYEDRIAQLRVEVDRLHSRQYAQAGNINLQLQELAQQQEVLTEQHQYVKLLAQKASELGIDTTAAAADNAPDPDQVSALDTNTEPTDLNDAVQQVQAMMTDTRLALAAIGEAADSSTDEILTQLKSIGIRPAMPDEGVGGPFLPADDGPDADSIVDDANAVMSALTRFKAAQGVIDGAPIHQPLATIRRVSSGFGNRVDPFTHGRAFHAGMDFPAPTGTTVLSAGDGKVTFVGQKSGYGNLVEVSHGGGLVTRYGHLSAFLVKEGQVVHTGTPIAKVGSTGRSTGPHLHFEVRQNDGAINPKPFLDVGKSLARFLAA